MVMINEKNKENQRNLTEKEKIFSVVTGVIAGVINGVFGGGGGMIVVPMLTTFLKYKPQNAHATALLIILPLSLVSGIFYAAFGSLDWRVGVPATVGVTLGGVAGALLLNKLSSKWTVIIFAIVMAAAGAKMLFF